MKTRIKKWGNSLALRIPKSVASEIGIDKETLCDVTLENGKLVVSPAKEPKYTLEELLAGVTKENIHQEIDFGPAVGKEAW